MICKDHTIGIQYHICTILQPQFIHINKNSVPKLIAGTLNSPNIDAKNVESHEPNAEPPELWTFIIAQIITNFVFGMQY